MDKQITEAKPSFYEELKAEEARIVREALQTFARSTLGRERAIAERLAMQAEKLVAA